MEPQRTRDPAPVVLIQMLEKAVKDTVARARTLYGGEELLVIVHRDVAINEVLEIDL